MTAQTKGGIQLRVNDERSVPRPQLHQTCLKAVSGEGQGQQKNDQLSLMLHPGIQVRRIYFPPHFFLENSCSFVFN